MWSAILACIALLFGFIAIFGLIGHCLGCRNPNKIERPKPIKKQKYIEDDYEDAAFNMIDVPEKDYEKSFQNSRLTSTFA